MEKKQKVAISISADILLKVDQRVDRVEFKNRSHVVESFIRKGLELGDDIGAIIVANENRWEGVYPFGYSKNLIQVDGKTLLEKQLEILEQASIGKVVIAISDQTRDIQKFLENRKYKIQIVFLEVGEESDSGEILLRAQNILQTPKNIFILGDNYFHNLNLTDLVYCHSNGDSKLTIVIKPEYNSKSFGNIELQGNKISQFKEKPSLDSDSTHIVNTGVYIIDSEIIPDIQNNFKLEYDFFPQYIEKFGAKAYFHNGAWFHVQSDEVLKMLS